MKKPLFPLVLVFIFVALSIGIYSMSEPLANTKELYSPADRIKINDIELSNDKITINLDNAVLAEFEDTNSMDPVLDDGTTAIEIIPEKESELIIGDIIVYESDYGDIIHRIDEISSDDQGTYFVMKGDNNYDSDPYRVRFNQIKYVLVGVLY
ncbi:MAG: hypothetical protein PHG05_02685 [Candidatus Nanoarchaeia archaeon]|nr:hypothetical protein [Candidatus Nanoarchaeia archaeon]